MFKLSEIGVLMNNDNGRDTPVETETVWITVTCKGCSNSWSAVRTKNKSDPDPPNETVISCNLCS